MSTSRRLLTSLTLVSALGFSSLAVAQYAGPQAVQPVLSVKQILEKPKDDQRVTLQGYLTKQISKEKYTFSDGTGEITVDIDTKLFPQGHVNEKTRVEISGEVDKSMFKDTKIEVDRVVLIP